jgi:cobalamin biosynthesis Co2+ chelatase CbiK
VTHTTNNRTKLEMPLKYQLYEDYKRNSERLSIERAIRSLKIPLLVCHGTNDEAVPIARAELLRSWQPAAEFLL